MATSNDTFEGSIGELSFYKRNGKTIVRKKGGPSAKQIKNAASCRAIRDSNRAFGSASRICALIRRSIGKNWNAYCDSDLTGRLTGQLKKLIERCGGIRGEQLVHLATHPEELKGFEFNKHCSFVSRCTAPLTVTFSADRNTAVLQTTFRPAADIVAPSGASSFQLVYTLLRLPVYGINETKKHYQPLNASETASEQVTSDFIYTTFDMRIKLSLPLTLPESAAEGTSLLCIVGIAFYNGAVRMGKEVCGMRVVRVG